MTDFQHPVPFRSALAALEKDLLTDGGEISTVRNYNFAILPYPPEEEFRLRRAIHELSGKLLDTGWFVGQIALHELLIRRIEAQEPGFTEAMIAREKRLSKSADKERGLRALKEKITNLLEGEDGLAKDVIAEVKRILAQSKQEGGRGPERTVIFIARAGALYPFMRTSALLKHLTGQTSNAPVVLLYPGKADDDGGLSFMGVVPADRDYRPRIYR